MNAMKTKAFAAMACVALGTVLASAAVIENVQVNTSGAPTNYVVSYTFNGTGEWYYVEAVLSGDNGASFPFTVEETTKPGSAPERNTPLLITSNYLGITINANLCQSGAYSFAFAVGRPIHLPNAVIRIVGTRNAISNSVPAGMVLIPAGSFNMGTNNLAFESEMTDAGPNHQVNISAFYMDKYEVTYTQWTNVRTWAISHGYSDLAAGSGKATNHPVQTVSWYDCVKWCNARSEMQGFTPCYYTSTNLIATNIYKIGSVNLSNNWVNWSVNGYRLPTDAEWEKAARGGLSGQRFPWQDLNITHTNANYNSITNFTYDTSATRGYHPTFAVGGYPYTSPVGSFAPNGYGLYDMAGNVLEWTWDWYDSAWYGNAGATQSDTPGPVSGSNRVLRGGDWSDYADHRRVAYRCNFTPDFDSTVIGFRSVCR